MSKFSKIKAKRLKTLEDFQNLKKWDKVLCKFELCIWHDKRKRKEGYFDIYENKDYHKEIILEKKDNIYFNYEMFLKWESNLIDILLITF